MIEVFKSLGKRKIFYTLIALQFTVSLVFFFISMAALQSAFYINIMVPKNLDVEPERVVHLSVQHGTNKVDFHEFVEDISVNMVESVGTYRSYDLFVDKFGGQIAATKIDSGIRAMKDIKLISGSHFDESDYEYDELLLDNEQPMSVLAGYDIAKQYDIKVGDVFSDDMGSRYVVKGILEPDSTWFFQTVSEGLILELDNQFICPQIEGIMLELHYYCVLSDKNVNQDVVHMIKQYAAKHEITLEVTLVADELEESFEKSYKENIVWIAFVAVMSVMIAIGTTILFVAQLNSRKKAIGIRLSVGYSPGKIMRLVIGEVLVLASVAYAVAICIGKLMLGTESQYFSGMSYSYGHYVSDEIILWGSVLVIAMCLPAIIALGVKVKRLQPKELIGGKE